MSTTFSENLRLVLKMLSMSNAKLASELGIDKSVVSRWLKGSAQPSAHNLSRLSTLVATHVDNFKVLDWERDPRSLAEMFGANPDAIPTFRAPEAMPGLPLAIWSQMIATTSLRGAAYEGFFRSTRPHPMLAGRFLHEYGLIRRDSLGLLRLTLGSRENVVDGWMIPLQGLMFTIAADVKSGTLLFGIFNGVGASRVEVFDGLTLIPGADMGRAPIATAMYCERVGDLSDDRDADDRRQAEQASQNPLAPEGSVPERIRNHLLRDFGPKELALGGELLLNMSLVRSMTRGPDYESLPVSKEKVPDEFT
ncbi:MAG: helix-turn-helix transcriptional regulator [Rhizomicrobium sp.]|jgi:transcriptional regulator with XRE-family HTH domain